ncbi:MAG: enoyl-CoA hydratase/isomerase family protein [Hyphomonadaceae bacterium]
MSAVQILKQGMVATIVFDRPPHNHVNVALLCELADTFEALDDDKSVRALVLASEGRNFCAGADLTADDNPTNKTGPSPFYAAAVRLFAAKKPVVAAIQGAAVGAGLGLALTADFRIAQPDARFTANFVKLGFHPGFGLTHTLPRLIGETRASLMFLTGRRITGAEAVDWGIASLLAEDARSAAQALAAEIAENAPLAVQSTRATLRAGLAAAVKAQTDHEDAEQTWLKETKDFAEGVRAVGERRAGNFIGE